MIHNTTPFSRVLIPRTSHSLLYGSLRSPIFSPLSSDPSRYFLFFLILCWSSLSSSLFYSFTISPLYSYLFSSILFRNGFLFYHLQFSSICFQYSLSYFSFSQLYRSFAIYLLGNSLLNIFLSSSASYCLTFSSLSLLYSFLNSSTNFIVFFRFFLLSQVSFSAVYPFHCTKILVPSSYFPLVHNFLHFPSFISFNRHWLWHFLCKEWSSK